MTNRPPFSSLSGRAGFWEETQDRKRSPSPRSTMVSSKIVFLYYYFISLGFLGGGGVEQFKTSRTQRTHKRNN